MAEPGQLGNDEPWNRNTRRIGSRITVVVKTQGKTMISVRPIAFFADFRPTLALRGMFVAAAFAAVAVPSVADARAGAYDGTWNVTFTPQAGNCHASNTVPFNVSGRRVSSAGGGKVTGGVTGNGNVSVLIKVGASWANGGGRLAGKSGAGRWSGVITGDRCSGVWQATRA